MLETYNSNEKDIDWLLEILQKSNNILVCNLVAFHLNKFKDERILSTLIYVIKKPQNIGKRGKLIYCCEDYDCSNYFDFFIEVVIIEEGESCINAIDVIGRMKGPFTKDQLNGAINNIDSYVNANSNKDMISYLKKLQKYLKKIK